MGAPMTDFARLAMFDVVRAYDPEDLNGHFRVRERAERSSRIYTYQLQDRALWRRRFEQPIFTIATRGTGSILASYAESSFATDVSVDGDDGSLYCFTTMLAGQITLTRGGAATTATTRSGLVWRPGPGGLLSISNDNARNNVFFKVADLEIALEHMLDERLRQPLEFESGLDWSMGLTASLKHQLDFVMLEFQRKDGVPSSPVALASLTDSIISLVLHGARHNYSDRLAGTGDAAIPAYVRRAEDFMRAHGTQPIRMADVAEAAGCSLRTLATVFKHFRNKTPLAVLHAIRLDLVRGELTRNISDASITTIARRYGFTNTTRFAAAFGRRFGKTPSETVRHASVRAKPEAG